MAAVNNIKMFKEAKLGDKFRNKKGEIFQVRRFVNSKTLEGVRYLYNKELGITLRQTTPKQWEPVE